MYIPRKEEDIKQNNIFKTRCMVSQRISNIIIDNRSRESIISKIKIDKSQLPNQPHLSTYRIWWVKDVDEMKVIEQYRIPFFITKYKDQVMCDVVDIDASHLLSSHPWQFDFSTVHNGENNTYTFYKDNMKFILVPLK